MHLHRYEGRWRAGLRHGQGLLQQANGDTYEVSCSALREGVLLAWSTSLGAQWLACITNSPASCTHRSWPTCCGSQCGPAAVASTR